MAPQTHPLIDSDIFFINLDIIQLALSYLILGCYATLSLLTIYLVLKKGISNSRPRQVLLSLTVFMLLLATCSVANTTTWNWLNVTLLTNSPISDPTFKKIQIWDLFIERSIFIVSDAIVLWRAWILYRNHCVIQTVLVTLFIGSLVAIILDIVDDIMGLLKISDKVNDDTSIILYAALPLVMNFFATSLIAYKAWSYRVNIKHNLAKTRRSKSQAEKVLALLVESGLIYMAFWIVFVVSLQQDLDSHFFQIYGILMPFVSALYPVLVILVVSMEMSRNDSEEDWSLSQSIRFASSPAEASETATSNNST
ncbi:hypothetical protein K435DRAFT_844477 [Dendrothele bispora CBS 962.96]|uniref:Uncharacterized protein n=1 Tax=Dendrothele bispora (strain CBS 962.96) TaxID=1314807 RepID=A0A4S8L1I4_DENBC|nr:hypothetical protein K435DRAFT_844477 [Dendrothele bispora CBS 962.96]